MDLPDDPVPTRSRQRSAFSWLHVFVLLVAVAAVALWFGLGKALSLADIQRVGRLALSLREQHYCTVLTLFFLAQLATGLFSTPTKGVLTLLGGALLGPIVGSLATELGIVLGTTVLFFATRRFLRERVAARLGNKFRWVERRIAARPLRAIIGLRLILTLPYGPITLTAALTRVPFSRFITASILGDLPVVVLYTLAGERLFALTTTREAISPAAIAIFVAAGIVLIAGVFFGRLAPTTGDASLRGKN